MRKLRPCGTKAAYERHRRNNETPCDLCKGANAAKYHPDGASALRVAEQQWDKALDADPPVIHYRKNNHGIWVHTFIHDPHADAGAHNRAKEACKWGHPFSEANTNVKANGARECRECKKRHNDARGAAA